jgi:hypothetical protein
MLVGELPTQRQLDTGFAIGSKVTLASHMVGYAAIKAPKVGIVKKRQFRKQLPTLYWIEWQRYYHYFSGEHGKSVLMHYDHQLVRYENEHTG